MESVQIYLLWLACVLLRLQYEVFCFALVISIFYKCPLYPRFAEHVRSKKLSVEQIRCKGRARL